MEKVRPLSVSITGIDGSGKSTVMNSLAEDLGQDINLLRISRPTFSIVEGEKRNHYTSLLRSIDALHHIADKTASPSCVLAANTVNVVLQGRVIEPSLIRSQNPELVVGTRDYLVDPSVYAIFYSPRLADKPMDERLKLMHRITGLPYREVIFFLTVPPDEAVARIEKRIQEERQKTTGVEREKWRHLHEYPDHLEMLQKEYYHAFDVVKDQSAQTLVYEIDTTLYPKAEIADLIGSQIRQTLQERTGSPVMQPSFAYTISPDRATV